MHKDKIQELLTAKGVSVETTTQFLKLLENCELARYSPSVTKDMQSDFEKAAKVISEIDKEV